MTGRGLVGRRLAQAILVAAIALNAMALLPLLLSASQNDIGPMFDGPPVGLGTLVVAIGIALNLLGLTWMVRIVRADPEAGPSSWRMIRG